ncbi:hypothetical protein CROQUDRAFT_218876 [Cronartium quercuum f. sp. fusiforme G11]|uniref:Uncharacterized protein n=1 Tax=Cronartium quercuum f. sp. fusiforme G11 TaxID=708437 RepID=A0A9P6NEL9_9BASI|nr:hypothetical protein CROQUDRAFT_218876 [Cronartium quercuum f. sp. fusiforme G11]
MLRKSGSEYRKFSTYCRTTPTDWPWEPLSAFRAPFRLTTSPGSLQGPSRTLPSWVYLQPSHGSGFSPNKANIGQSSTDDPEQSSIGHPSDSWQGRPRFLNEPHWATMSLNESGNVSLVIPRYFFFFWKTFRQYFEGRNLELHHTTGIVMNRNRLLKSERIQ